MTERTLTLVVTEGGEVLFEGRTVSARRGERGYYSVQLPLHRVVAHAFHGAPPTRKHVCHHKDGNPRNNSAANLQWLTQGENTRAHFAGKKRKLSTKQVSEILSKKPSETDSLRDLAEAFGVSYHTVAGVRSGTNWKKGSRKSNRAILTASQVEKIRNWAPPTVTAAMLARRYHVSDRLILNIWHGLY